MIGIRRKLMLGFGGLLAVIAVVGTMTMVQVDDLGRAVDRILRENYRSVVACTDMMESLDRMDCGILFTLAGNEMDGNRLIEQYASGFQEALCVELGNITLPGEREKAERIATLFGSYAEVIPAVMGNSRSLEARLSDYSSTVLPLFQEIRDAVNEILIMNQSNMIEASNAAHHQADSAHRIMLTAIIVSAFLALLFSNLAQRWILHPINRLIESANEIRGGNLDLVLEGGSRDEIGRLSESFNEMAAALRRVRKEDRVNLMRTRRATEEVFRALPTAIAVLDPDGEVEVSTETADRQFGLRPGVQARDLGFEWLLPMVQEAMDENRTVERDPASGYIQHFVDQREYFIQPMVVPIPAGPESGEPTGVALILKDVTQVHEQLEMKQGVVSTVSHQLRTPLTSLRMGIHLLLDERIGPLNEKQVELLLAARDESERLAGILTDLLDIHRYESGGSMLALEAVSPRTLVRDSMEPFIVEARDRGVTMVNNVSDDLPEVLADVERMGHVLANLLSNALRFTQPGGTVSIRSEMEQDRVAFLVEDTGKGIPGEELEHLFTPFYRAPDQDEKSGVGLGLSIAKEIVRAHGGDIRAESMPGKGSTFRFTLPAKSDADRSPQVAAREEQSCSR